MPEVVVRPVPRGPGVRVYAAGQAGEEVTHYQEAEKILAELSAVDQQMSARYARGELTHCEHSTLLAEKQYGVSLAQVHATLALVEERQS